MQEESLEQALKLQIQKRIEVESKASNLHSHIHDLQELLEALVLEVSTEQQQQQQQQEGEEKDKEKCSINDMNDIDGVDHDPWEEEDHSPANTIAAATPTMTSLKHTTTPMTTTTNTNTNTNTTNVMMERRDVLWMLQEIQIRIQNMMTLTPPNTHHAWKQDEETTMIPQLKLHYETQLAKLQGQLTQIQEELLQERQMTTKEPPQARVATTTATTAAAAAAATTNTTTSLQEQFQMLQSKHDRLEKRHGILLKDMQHELEEKQKRIHILEKELESVASLNTIKNGLDDDDDKQSNDASSHPPPMSSPTIAMLQSPHKDLLIASLQEDIEERDLVIAELKAELEQQEQHCDGDGVGLGVFMGGHERIEKEYSGEKCRTDHVHGNGNAFHHNRHHRHSNQEADKVKIKYMEGIIHGLERKIEYLEQHCNTNHGECPMEDSKTMSQQQHQQQYHSPLIKNRTTATRARENLVHDWLDDSHKHMMNESLAPGGYSSLQVEDMELEIAELMARLKDCQEEKMLLEQELRQWKEGGHNISMLEMNTASHAGPQ
jgi:hypothetical protein